MHLEPIRPDQQDKQAVHAVRGGDAERYRELVERHERHVYAVAWSRLGDAALAEEATQEAFIRAYQGLWLLGDGAKFAAWIASIARRVAINLGLRHRRELTKRQRWALEQTLAGALTTDEPEAPCTPETLRQTLADLPAAHRECLVLFYLEGKSGAEAAAALGISEAALRVRLHRARAAMRERLEERLAESLEKLRPARTLVPSVMAAVLASSSVKATATGGFGATLVGVLAKYAPLKWVFPFIWFIVLLPMLGAGIGWLFAQTELRNFRDPKGFRARLFREDSIRQAFGIVVLFVAAWLLVLLFRRVQVNQAAFLFIAGLIMTRTVINCRRTAINRSRYFLANYVLGPAGIGMGFLIIGLGWLPWSAFGYFLFGPAALLTLWTYGKSPNWMRMDYNLFLRAAEGMFERASAENSIGQDHSRLNRNELLTFARFLSARCLINDYRWQIEGLALQLTAIKGTIWPRLEYWPTPAQHSRVVLAWDGTAAAVLGAKDQAVLRSLHGNELPAVNVLADSVAVALQLSWHHFRLSDYASAERALGQVLEREVFMAPAADSSLVRRKMVIVAFLLGCAVFLTLLLW